jgi:SAM-dependent methyltransferase
MADERARAMETEFILSALDYVSKQAGVPLAQLKVADVGCGNGYTLEILSQRYPQMQLFGFEYTPQLRTIAEKRFEGNRRVVVKSADIRTRETLGSQAFDLIICQRVLINLLEPSHQQQALKNIVDVIKEGGYLLSIEAYESGLANLNMARAEFDLPPIPPAHHNLNLKDDFFSCCPQLRRLNVAEIPSNFMSTHHFTARVIHPILLGNKTFKRNSFLVNFLSQALKPNVGDFSAIRGAFFIKEKYDDR